MTKPGQKFARYGGIPVDFGGKFALQLTIAGALRFESKVWQKAGTIFNTRFMPEVQSAWFIEKVPKQQRMCELDSRQDQPEKESLCCQFDQEWIKLNSLVSWAEPDQTMTK